MNRSQLTRQLKELALKQGFAQCGISKAGFLEEDAPRLEQWLQAGRHGQMGYMANHFDKRLDPTLLVPGAKSVVSLLFNYFPAERQNPEAPKLARYAYGEDYHRVLKDKLYELAEEFRETTGITLEGRIFTDSAPVLERSWAVKSGLGWIGKNGNLLSRQGSYFFLAEMILTLELDTDGPVTDHCGTCTACLDACPTDAILAPRVVDGSRCISYFTIELKEEIPAAMQGKLADWVFGCDICQEVCPWNRFSSPHTEPRFNPAPELMGMNRQDWIELTADIFGKLFKNSAVKRTGYQGIKRNLEFLETSSN